MESVKVYRIDKISVHNNSHKTDREESWQICEDSEFPSMQQALDYVVRMNRRTCAYDLGIFRCDNASVSKRCTDPAWAHRQKYFTYKPNIEDIALRLREDHIACKIGSKLDK